jgi:SAM-dependent methyltransferase
MTSAEWPAGVPSQHDADSWWQDHFDTAASEIVEFLGGDGIDLAGKRVADIGCGDGIIDLGVYLKGSPELLVGYDLRPVDVEALRTAARARGIDDVPDANSLAFVVSEPNHIPAPPDTFDVVFSWSTFEHVSDLPAMFREIRRILRPDGALFLQIWPLFHSFHGGHLWLSVQQPFAHLRFPPHEIEGRLDGHPATDPTRTALDEFRSLNRATLDDLQRAMLVGGLRPTKVKPTAEAFHVPLEVSHLPLSLLSISGIQLIAVPG